MFASCCVSITNNTNSTVNLLTYVPLRVSTFIGSSSGVVMIYIFLLLNCEAYIHIYIHRLTMTTFSRTFIFYLLDVGLNTRYI
jgi:hypothetical protein